MTTKCRTLTLLHCFVIERDRGINIVTGEDAMATSLAAVLSGSNGRVRVFLRTRPTRKFATEMINFDEDGQVIKVVQKRQVDRSHFPSLSYSLQTVYVHVPRNEDLGVINNKRQGM